MNAKKIPIGLACAMSAMAMFAAAPAAATVVPASGTVVQINTYTEFGNGDVVFRLTNNVAGCEAGFWLSPSQLGFKTNVAFIMQARATGETITVGGNDALIWNGSAGRYCKVDWVSIMP